MRRTLLARAIATLAVTAALGVAGSAAATADSGWGRPAPELTPTATTDDSGWGAPPAEPTPTATTDDSGWG
ncbi:hypothetical protein HHL19_36500 [Streptomyces sp. R302]|uniref:hypothetical protein n=1 Tax=unclassified Streptomyces TaxID=2593676 RepID=UPI00145DE18D|nr:MULTISPECIES: hypothetical protein [unclassified Streptomyces]NML55645.1 hypothetical protein [Streptomyces sp. R301]NML84013.1 hypothetical protein [Streptomyces sp. R302]